ncbi:iron-siderophore ABC transporter substrate-binding protein [Rhodococcus sp. BP-349]|uniref:iron-siderophore ABC transporter substrate-binding protein n=1 Tax=unclassified Rhodococcus (in: high G+C Gram-positive bacteria) TaxID=192944 RepID=UPI001C9B9317|nr:MULTISPECIES: iron-siderophore ABC transporter substrate-binding protein [unclassified Rhodococcus (in: high G+C Gram-positive bacteria)]MBY6538462.1 iron-siderophore ABC transporter substrate-binding protein [Rhodococcus sp. BP-363]MBY6542799.1 iron-siderophore ABC transporter substrate-binding protein [Rhodococcus sp. BP-369]MBY6562029.1 iron-siderophore ABC transporter substrate-binding protein [Rhodococcus sp. BP-370]MBY6576321.1 iron-siderophore ABC transporter substrate-binding protein
MSRIAHFAVLSAAAVLTTGLVACSSDSTGGATTESSTTADWTPVTIEHALGTTVIESRPERVATVNWANHEVPLALGIVPVGMAAANFGDDDDDGVLPWVDEKLQELGAETPVLFDETDGVDFEAVADTDPDVILAAYSGLTQEDYDQLSEIAPVVAYPETAWGTPWRDMIEVSSTALGKADEGRQLIADLDERIDAAVAEHPGIAGRSAMFLTHVDTTNLSEVSFYTTHDTRTMFFEDLGMTTPPSVATASAATDRFSLKQSAEQADAFGDVDIIVTYGGDELVAALEADPLLSQMPAVQNDAIVALPGTGPLGTASNPTPLSVDWVLDDYLDLLDGAAASSR